MTDPDPEWPPFEDNVLVVQPLPGIGDMVWHLPHLRAIAAHAGGPVTVMAKPRSLADQLLASEPAVSEVIWVDMNPPNRRGMHDGIGGFLRLSRKLHAADFGSIVILHHSDRIAAAAWKAGIPDRRGYGWKRQRWFLNCGPYLPADMKNQRPHGRATSYIAATGIQMASAEPSLTILPGTINEAMARLDGMNRAFVAVGIGSSEPSRQWGAEKFTAFAAALLNAGWPALVLLGGPDDMLLANTIRNGLGGFADRVRMILGWNLGDVAGVLSQAAYYAGNDTGVMNMAAAAGVRAYAFFGTTPPIYHASQVVAVTSPDTGVIDGMTRLTVNAAIQAIIADRGRLGP